MYADVDKAIERVSEYDEAKHKRIDGIKERLSIATSPDVKRQLMDWLITEYESFISDSALFYVNLNLENPEVKGNEKLKVRLQIKKADIAAHAGLFGEATEILESLPRDVLKSDTALLVQYYSAYSALYQYQSEYATDSEYARNHEKLRELYIDSVSQFASPSSITYLINRAAADSRAGEYEKAEKLLLDNLGLYKSGDRNYSILASILADVYKNQGDHDAYQKYIGLSVISDLQGAVKENMAIRALATECFEEGDIERADRYLRQSFADANFYAARMRNAQSSRMLPIIGDSYNFQQKKLNHQLRLLVIFISILAFGFIVISIFALVQVKRVRAINRKTQGMLEEVSELSDRLSKVNEELSATNEKLKTSGKIQGEYGVLFMEYCSMAISALQQYQQSLKVTAVQGNLALLKKKIDSANIENQTLAEFYNKFDEAILNIYPNFVERFNQLLQPEYRVDLKPKEALTTELRVFALIRIGINDSEKIAKFLRCSISTVYTYRSKVKKRATEPDKFEEMLMQI